MRFSMQRYLFLAFLAVLLLGMVLAAGLEGLAVERLYLANLRENLLAQANLTARALQDTPLPEAGAEAYSQSANVLPGVHTHLLEEQDGVILSLPFATGEMAVPVPPVENSIPVSPQELRQRPEIQSALLGTAATAVRRVPSAGDRRVLYAASPIYAETGVVSSIVYLATPLPPGGLPSAVLFQLIGAVLVAVLLAGTLGGLLARRFARPLEEFAQAAESVADGDLERPVPVDFSVREMHRLGLALKAMTDSLRRAEQVRNAFLADITHELRSPLTVIKGTVETLEDGAVDDIEGRGALLASMHHETNRLIRLVNDLLLLARVDAGALSLKMEAVNLAELARSRCAHLAVLAGPRRVALNVESKGEAWMVGDADRLSQVLDNLLENAIRHSPEDSTVSILLQQQDCAVQCAVRDQGTGIPAAHLPFIFERFYRADGARTRHTGGSGLGLAIVRSLVAAHGGTVRAESSEGQGTTITFWLPGDGNCHEIA